MTFKYMDQMFLTTAACIVENSKLQVGHYCVNDPDNTLVITEVVPKCGRSLFGHYSMEALYRV